MHCVFAVLVPAVIALAVAFILWPLSRSKRFALNTMTWIVGLLGCTLAGIRLEVQNREQLQQPRPAIFIFNHQSGVDPVILARLLRRDVVAVANAKLKPHPVIGPLMQFGDTLFVDKDKSRANEDDISNSCVQRAVEKSLSGLSIVVAPEGTRTRGKILGEFRSGAFVMAAKLAVPVIPIVIRDAHDVLPPDSLEMRPGKVSVTVLAPRWVEDTPESIATERSRAYQEMYDQLVGEVTYAEKSESSFTN